jgi:alpha-N-arabinofuranosidase
MTLSMVNLDPRRAAKIEIAVNGREVRTVTGRVLTAESMDARPEFGKVDPLVPATLNATAVRRGVVSLVAPAKSVVVLELR